MKLHVLVKKIRDNYKWWNDIATHGCGDPFWEDGCNMNLIRNHIILLRSQISTQAREEMQPVPGEVYWALPPEVPNTYMVLNGENYQERVSNWDSEKIKRIVLKTDLEAALF